MSCFIADLDAMSEIEVVGDDCEYRVDRTIPCSLGYEGASPSFCTVSREERIKNCTAYSEKIRLLQRGKN